jgi:HTH-type transcriptional regulator/antitoxin HigA
MEIKLIRSEEDLQAAFARLEEVWGAEPDTAEGEELELLSILIENYENKHYPIESSDPIEAIRFRMDQSGLTQRDLKAFIGNSGRVSEVMNRKRPLTMKMVRRLHDGLRIPYDSLMA